MTILPEGRAMNDDGADPSRPQAGLSAERLAALPRLPREKEGPVFAEPWQAHAFALAVQLSEAGHFTWTEWVAALGAELKAAAERGTPDDGSRYYQHWLAALERLVTEKGLADQEALAARHRYLGTGLSPPPHRGPVERGSDPAA